MTRKRIYSFTLTTLAACVVVAGLGCSRQEASLFDKKVLERWITEEPTGEKAQIFDEYEVFTWRFKTEQDIEPWNAIQIDWEYRLTGSGLYMRSHHHDPQLHREVDLEAEDLRVIRIEHSGLIGEEIKLFWAAPNEAFSEEKSLSVDKEDPGDALNKTYTFEVGRHPHWKGKIGRIRLDPTSQAERRVQLFSITGLDRRVNADRLAVTVSRPWRIDLDRDVRSALYAPPGVPIERRVDLPAGSALRLAWAVEQMRGPAVDFRVVVEPEGGTARTVIESRVDPAVGARKWNDASVDLSDFEGPCRIRLETSSDEALDLQLGFPMWANPEVVAPVGDTPTPPNVVLIVIDTLRADHMSLYGYERQTSPQIESWAKRRGVVFENSVASAPWTLPAHVTLFTGLDPLTHDVNHGHPAPASLTMVAERLRDAGYATAAITGGAYLTPSYAMTQGFDRFEYALLDDTVKIAEGGKDLPKGIERALSYVSEQATRPFFLFFHTYAVHAPYDAHEPWFSEWHQLEPRGQGVQQVRTTPLTPHDEDGWRQESKFMERLKEPPLPEWEDLRDDRLQLATDLYDSGIAYADAQIGRLLDRLQELGLEDDTLVILTSDHGEALGEKGLAGHSQLYELNLMVPLVIALPDASGAGSRVKTQVRQMDIAPTVHQVAGLKVDQPLDGQSLLPLIEDPSAEFPGVARSYGGSANAGISLRVNNRWKYVYQHSSWPPLHDQRQLFDLTSDPEEENNLAAESEREAAFFNQVYEGYKADSRNFRLEIHNTSAETLRVSLRGKVAHAFQVKGFQIEADRASWSKGEARLLVPTGESEVFYLEGVPQGEMHILVTFEEDPSKAGFSRVLDVAEMIENPFSAVFFGKEWRFEAPADESRTRVRISWHGEPPGELGSGEIDPELKEQLLALGYVGG